MSRKRAEMSHVWDRNVLGRDKSVHHHGDDFNLAIDRKLRVCDLVRLRVNDVCVGGQLRDRATVIQQKTGRPVQFEVTEQT
jgi:hypothetical protein